MSVQAGVEKVPHRWLGQLEGLVGVAQGEGGSFDKGCEWGQG